MYNKVECVRLSCDNCGEIYSDDDGTGFSIWLDNGSAWDYAQNDGWHNEEQEGQLDKHYCPDCYKIDNEDNLIIKPITQPSIT